MFFFRSYDNDGVHEFSTRSLSLGYLNNIIPTRAETPDEVKHDDNMVRQHVLSNDIYFIKLHILYQMTYILFFSSRVKKVSNPFFQGLNALEIFSYKGAL